VDLSTTKVDDQSEGQKPVKSIDKEQVTLSSDKSVSCLPYNPENHDKSSEPVLDGFLQQHFREASCASFVSLPAVDTENDELKVEEMSQKVQETNLPLSDECSTLGEEREKSVEKDIDDAVVISATEQCVDAIVFGQHLVIASHINEEAPKFWHLHNGLLDVDLTQNIDAQYKRSLAEQNITFGGRNHAQLFCFNEFLVYVRKRSTSLTPCVIRVSRSNQLSIVAHVHLPDSYFSVVLPEPDSLIGPFSMYVVREGVLEQRSADLKLLRSIEVPKLTEEIPNLSSNAGKKKLLSYTVAVTEDRRYFVIVCPTVGEKSGRYLDVVDLKENCYLHRAALDTRFVWKVLEDGVRPAGTERFELVSLRTLTHKAQTFDYCCVTQSDLQIRSPDGQYGVELTPDYSIHIWRTISTPERTVSSLEQNTVIADQKTPTPEQITSDQTASNTDHSALTPGQSRPTLEHCCALSGHVAEVTCVSWASMDSHLLVSGSRDNTIRLWSLVGSGSQLCLFHVLGTIDDVHFDDTSRYVVVHCSYAAQRKRAVVLKITNVMT